jgi:NADPH:quinone reductase-like Zn-dependent oxidoreductase
MQGVGIVAAVGDSASHIKVGTPVALMTFGSYAEFTEVLHFVPFYCSTNYLVASVLQMGSSAAY